MKQFMFFLAMLFMVNAAFSQNTATKPKTSTTQKAVVPAKGRMVQISTDYGNIVIRLYDSTPLHRDNFIKLVKEGFYDSLLFHRVIEGIVFQISLAENLELYSNQRFCL